MQNFQYSILTNFSIIEFSYLQLLKDLDSPILPGSITTLAKTYFDFAKGVHEGFFTQDFSHVHNAWINFEMHYESQKINPLELKNILNQNSMDYSIFKDYLCLITDIQESISVSLLELFTFDLTTHDTVRDLIPPFFLFMHWLKNSDQYKNNMNQYFQHFTQEHVNSLAYFNHIPQLEYLIDKFFLLSKGAIDNRSFYRMEYFNFNTTNLFSLNKKGLIFDTALKNNTISLPEQFVDYIQYSISKFEKNPDKRQSHFEVKDLQDFLKVYEKNKMEYLFPMKHIKFKTNKI